MSGSASTRLLQMASQAFPIGGYSHSQGLEAAVDCGLVADEGQVRQWIVDVLQYSLGTYELPCLEVMSYAWLSRDIDAVSEANEEFLASRESAELRSATVQMGFSMRALLAALPEMPDTLLNALRLMAEPSLPCVWSGLATAWAITPGDSMTAYLWSWAENQVLVAMKSVPIGQSSGQRILWHIGGQIERLVRGRQPRGADERAHGRDGQRSRSTGRAKDTELRSNFAPGLAILSSQHETQYSRLFRS